MITLIGKDLASEGTEFVFLGPAEECESCRFKSSCVGSLEVNRKRGRHRINNFACGSAARK